MQADRERLDQRRLFPRDAVRQLDRAGRADRRILREATRNLAGGAAAALLVVSQGLHGEAEARGELLPAPAQARPHHRAASVCERGADMDRKTAWVVPAFAGVVMLVICFNTVGGFNGIARSPGVSLGVFAIVLVIAGSLGWRDYRRLRDDPIMVEVAEAEPGRDLSHRLDQPPVVLVASRLKSSVRPAFMVAFGAIWVGLSLAQPGVCRVVSLTAYLPFLMIAFVMSVSCVLKPERIALAPEGLTYLAPWGNRHWSWDQIREIKLVKTQISIPFIRWFRKGRPSRGIYFKVFYPAGAVRRRSRYGLGPVWRYSGDELALLLEAARTKWSTSAAAELLPPPWFDLSRLHTIVLMMVCFGTVWMWYAQPCAR